MGAHTARLSRADFDLVIVGGGMVGASLACALGEQAISVAVIEAQPIADPRNVEVSDSVADFEPRVSALTLASRNFLTNLNAWPYIAAHRNCPFEHMVVWDAEGTGQITFAAADIGQLSLGCIVENALITDGLYRRLSHLSNVELIVPASIASLSGIQDGRRLIRLEDGREVTARLLVGADGARSRVRELAGIDVRQRDYHQSAIVTTVRTGNSHQLTAWQRFLPTGPLAFLPLLNGQGDDHYCSIVWSVDNDQLDAVMALSDQAFAGELGKAFEYKLGKVEEVAQRFSFPLRLRHAQSYVAESIALVGDAAHTIHPLAGQGVNLGFLDSAVFAEEVRRALLRGVPLTDPSLLSRYQRRRIADNLVMMNLMTGFKQLFAQRSPALRWARNTGMNLMNQLGPVKNHVAARAMGLTGDLPASARPGYSFSGSV